MKLFGKKSISPEPVQPRPRHPISEKQEQILKRNWGIPPSPMLSSRKQSAASSPHNGVESEASPQRQQILQLQPLRPDESPQQHVRQQASHQQPQRQQASNIWPLPGPVTRQLPSSNSTSPIRRVTSQESLVHRIGLTDDFPQALPWNGRAYSGPVQFDPQDGGQDLDTYYTNNLLEADGSYRQAKTRQDLAQEQPSVTNQDHGPGNLTKRQHELEVDLASALQELTLTKLRLEQEERQASNEKANLEKKLEELKDAVASQEESARQNIKSLENEKAQLRKLVDAMKDSYHIRNGNFDEIEKLDDLRSDLAASQNLNERMQEQILSLNSEILQLKHEHKTSFSNLQKKHKDGIKDYEITLARTMVQLEEETLKQNSAVEEARQLEIALRSELNRLEMRHVEDTRTIRSLQLRFLNSLQARAKVSDRHGDEISAVYDGLVEALRDQIFEYRKGVEKEGDALGDEVTRVSEEFGIAVPDVKAGDVND
jgi:hypothetical protein